MGWIHSGGSFVASLCLCVVMLGLLGPGLACHAAHASDTRLAPASHYQPCIAPSTQSSSQPTGSCKAATTRGWATVGDVRQSFRAMRHLILVSLVLNVLTHHATIRHWRRTRLSFLTFALTVELGCRRLLFALATIFSTRRSPADRFKRPCRHLARCACGKVLASDSLGSAQEFAYWKVEVASLKQLYTHPLVNVWYETSAMIQ